MKQLITSVFFSLLFISASYSGEIKSISIATIEWVPYSGKNLRNFGFSSEILSEAFKRVGYDVDFRFMPWVRCLKEVEVGNTDTLCLAYYSKERTKIYDFSEKYVDSVLVFYKRKDLTFNYQTLQDLKPYRIGVRRGFVNTEEFDNADFLTKDIVDSEKLNLKKLAIKRIDLTLIDKYVAKHLLNTISKDSAPMIELVDPPLETKPMYLLFSKKINGYQQKLKDFNRGLKMINEDGTISKIMESQSWVKRVGFE